MKGDPWFIMDSLENRIIAKPMTRENARKAVKEDIAEKKQITKVFPEDARPRIRRDLLVAAIEAQTEAEHPRLADVLAANIESADEVLLTKNGAVEYLFYVTTCKKLYAAVRNGFELPITSAYVLITDVQTGRPAIKEYNPREYHLERTVTEKVRALRPKASAPTTIHFMLERFEAAGIVQGKWDGKGPASVQITKYTKKPSIVGSIAFVTAGQIFNPENRQTLKRIDRKHRPKKVKSRKKVRR